MDQIKENLNICGLTPQESEEFIKLINKLNIPKSWIDNFYKEWDDSCVIPFEGGMFFSEALVALKETYNE